MGFHFTRVGATPEPVDRAEVAEAEVDSAMGRRVW